MEKISSTYEAKQPLTSQTVLNDFGCFKSNFASYIDAANFTLTFF